MSFSRSHVRRIGLVVLLAFISVRVSDAHLHMCMDGLEAPVTVHTADGSIHNDSHHHQEEHHQDRDIEHLDAMLFKAGVDAEKFNVGFSLPAIGLIPLSTGYPSDSPSSPPLRPPSRLLPPLRGPPA